MTTTVEAPPITSVADAADKPIPVTRRRIDVLLVAVGAAAAVVLFIAGGLLLWGATFASDYVHDELVAQNITFPPASALEEEGRDDLLQYADEQVDTGAEAEAYAGFIAGHVEGIADGATYSELGDEERAAEAAATDAITSGAPADEVAALEEEAAGITGQRDAIFRGEMLRGTLLNTYAWDTIGRIAGIAAWVAFAAGAVMTGLVVAGAVHLRRLHRAG
jgi:hypothetical protein